MGHLLYLMFRCDFDVIENLESLEEFGGSEHRLGQKWFGACSRTLARPIVLFCSSKETLFMVAVVDRHIDACIVSVHSMCDHVLR